MLPGALFNRLRPSPAPTQPSIPTNSLLLPSSLLDDFAITKTCPLRTQRLLPSSLCDNPLTLSSLSGVLCNKSEAQLLPFHAPAHSLQRHRDATKSTSFNSSTLHSSTSALLSPSESTLTAKLRVLPCFGRNRPPASPLDATLTRSRSVSLLDATLTKNWGVGGRSCSPGQARYHPHLTSIEHARFLYPLLELPLECRELRSQVGKLAPERNQLGFELGNPFGCFRRVVAASSRFGRVGRFGCVPSGGCGGWIAGEQVRVTRFLCPGLAREQSHERGFAFHQEIQGGVDGV